ncbi:OsmC family protein [Rhodococcus sp. G-MC3]|uniref:OsmC family protein n=1 Tax=Rhodococcus sp. G-MC3 TaxID=3046209 RepID=UPI0024B8A116|nr:OsmC family protein [Rhodococcus sp. G-MC3]MDJ0394945.1 OsmC family protein [Rhodococcus sp. G-MC3]
MRTHTYSATTVWTGNRGPGTTGAGDYDRSHTVSIKGKPDLFGSADPSFRGDFTRWNPEEMLVASLSACHMLWYLGLTAAAGVVVTDYRDFPSGIMTEESDGGGQFTEVVLTPMVTVADSSMFDEAQRLHHDASSKCFIARSVNFPVRHQPKVAAA